MGEFDFEEQAIIEEKHDKTYARPTGAVYPTFFVGIGGCGCEIVQKIRDLLASRSDFRERYEKLVQFIAIDTDMDDLNRLTLQYKFLISDFPKGEYIKVKLGREYQERDERFASWWPEWYQSRPDSTKGAGQIRIESRLALWYQLEGDRGGLIEQFNDAINRAKDHDNPFRVVRPPLAYCHIFCSVAGGTGSGGFLTLAYLFRELLEAHRLTPVLIGHFLLPTLFYRKVRARLHDDIRANGYAALKELEWFMTLGYTNNPRMQRGDIPDPKDDHIVFRVRADTEQTKVTMPPFQLVNLIDEPGDFSFAEPSDIYPAIAGCAYVQLFSPIIGQRESEEDNYYKKIKHLENGFSLNYGSYGLSMLVLPDRDILDYCENVMMKGLLEYLGGGKQQLKDSELLDRMVNTAALEAESCEKSPGAVARKQMVQALLQAGVLDRLRGKREKAWKIISEGWGEATTKKGLFHKIKQFVDQWAACIVDEIDSFSPRVPLDDDTVPDKPTGKPEDLREVCERLSEKLRSQLESIKEFIAGKVADAKKALVGLEKEIASFAFEGVQPGPMVQRAALVAAAEYLRNLKKEIGEVDESSLLPEKTRFEESSDSLRVAWEKKRLRYPLTKHPWATAKREQIPPLWKADIEDRKPKLRAFYLANLYSVVLDWVDQQLEGQKVLNQILRSISDGLEAKIEKALLAEGGMCDEFVLADEVFRGIRTRKRHWGRLWSWLVKEKVKTLAATDEYTDICFEVVEREGVEYIEPKIGSALELQSLLMAEYRKVVDQATGGQGGADAARKVSQARLEGILSDVARRFCRKRLVGLILGRRQAGDDREYKGLMIDECLELEARWELEELYVQDYFANYEQKVHGGVSLLDPEEKEVLRTRLINQFEPSIDDIKQYIQEKIMFVADKARCFARFRLTETTAVDPFTFICLHNGHYEKEAKLLVGPTGGISLCSFIKNCHPRFRTSRVLEGWTDEKRIVFFNAQAGLPVHNFWPVNGELKEAYERVYRQYVTGFDPKGDPVRDFPSHIDSSMEDPWEWDPHAILPSLDPSRVIRQQERGLRHFMELLAYGLVKEVPVSELDLDGTDASARRLSASWAEALNGGHVEDKNTAKVWILDVGAPATPRGVDPVLIERKKGFREVLGDRLDRAFERYSNEFGMGKLNKRKIEQVEEILRQRKREEVEKEDPEEFRSKLQEKLQMLREARDTQEVLLEQGYRVEKYLDFLDSSIDSLKVIYEEYYHRGKE